MGRLIRKGVFFTLLLACAAPVAAADPILMFLLSMAREMIGSHAERAPSPPDPQLPDLARVYPGTTVEPDHLRRLIDDSFVYLGDSQRREIFDALHAALTDPKNAAVRGTMIDFFVHKALTVRAAQQQLAQLSWREKERLAGEFGKEIASLSAEERSQLGELLRQGLLPVPSDLNQLLLAAFESR